MGVCIRTGANMMLDLSQIIWKRLVGQKITLDNLQEIEKKFVDKMNHFLTISESEFNQTELFWTTILTDNLEIELKQGGSSIPVAYADRVEYVKLSMKAKLLESTLQCLAIKRGISKIIPSSILNIVTSKELEIWICGKNNIDIDLLKRHTTFGGQQNDLYNKNSPVIEMFWQFLSSCREDEKQKFIKFCWGQERIPANDEDFKRNNVRFMIKPASKTKYPDQDILLPKADTCFFNLELPNYSNIDVMREKILKAITLDCVSMNAED
jgi:other hect domain ubiquitin protein ligase E3